MKHKIILVLSIVALTWVVGCKQDSNSTTDTAKERPAKTETATAQAADAIKKTVEMAKETGARVVEDVKTAGAQAVTSVTEKAKEVAAPASTKAQELIDSAKRLFTEGKFADALAQLNRTSEASPSTEQQSVVASLKTQIEKALAAAGQFTTETAKSATNALNNWLSK